MDLRQRDKDLRMDKIIKGLFKDDSNGGDNSAAASPIKFK